jgi:ankyrin repeat protein
MLASRHSNEHSSLATVKLLLEFNCDVNLLNDNGWSALMLASRYSSTDSCLSTVKILLENGSNVNLQNNGGSTSLILTCHQFQLSIDAQTEELHDKILNICRDTVIILIEYGADVNLQDCDGETALILACKYFNNNELNIVKLLLKSWPANISIIMN